MVEKPAVNYFVLTVAHAVVFRAKLQRFAL